LEKSSTGLDRVLTVGLTTQFTIDVLSTSKLDF